MSVEHLIKTVFMVVCVLAYGWVTGAVTLNALVGKGNKESLHPTVRHTCILVVGMITMSLTLLCGFYVEPIITILTR